MALQLENSMGYPEPSSEEETPFGAAVLREKRLLRIGGQSCGYCGQLYFSRLALQGINNESGQILCFRCWFIR
jgi:hypothetical protein